MTAEAAVLGTPAIRFNDFVGKLGYLEELEHVYGLTFGISATQPQLLLQKIDELLLMGSLKENWMKKRTHLLESTIDPTKFFTRFIGDYPDSTRHIETH
jgi:predicted glycosyltransferase